MRKLFTMIVAGSTLLVCSNLVRAQDGSTTKKDAIFFINKVFENFSRTRNTIHDNNVMWGGALSYDSQGFIVTNDLLKDSTIVSINRCSLTIQSYYTLVKPIKIDKKTDLVKLVLSAQIDLSSSKLTLDDSGMFIGLEANNQSKFHFNTAVVYYHAKENRTNIIETNKLSDPLFLTGDFSDIALYKLLDSETSGYSKGKYNDRLVKAFNFLIDNCGGGEVKAKPMDTGTKF